MNPRLFGRKVTSLPLLRTSNSTDRMAYQISGIQQVGIGVPQVDEAWDFYAKTFGQKARVFREAAPAPFMTRYTGNTVQSRDALLAINLAGGGGMEIWQYTSRTPEAPKEAVRLGDLGIVAARIRCRNVSDYRNELHAWGVETLHRGQLQDPLGRAVLWLRDPYGNPFYVVQDDRRFSDVSHLTSGPAGVQIGVSDVDRSIALYRDVLGYDVVAFDETGTFEDLAPLAPDLPTVRRVILQHSQARKGPFSELFGSSEIELIERQDKGGRKIFENRYWGDLGYIHLCFDITGMEGLKASLEAAGYPFTVDSGTTFDMGDAGGHFTYIEDPDGTLIEFVETHRIPILKKLGWYLDLRKRDPAKPLPRLLVKMMGWFG